MAKRKAKSVRLEIDPSARDFVMARLAAGRAAAVEACASIDDALNLFVNPDQDRRGKTREELIGDALEALGCACRAVEMAEATFEQVDMTECEPWDDDGVSEDDDDDSDDEDEDEDDDDDEEDEEDEE